MSLDEIKYAERMAAIEQDSKSIHRRLDDLEQLTKSVYRLTTTVEELQKDLSRVITRLSEIEQNPSKRWELAVTTFLSSVISISIAFLLNKII